jgi:hypothetical protein
MVKYLRISSYIRTPFLIYDFAPRSHLNFLIYEENFVFFFISAFSSLIMVQHAGLHDTHTGGFYAIITIA